MSSQTDYYKRRIEQLKENAKGLVSCGYPDDAKFLSDLICDLETLVYLVTNSEAESKRLRQLLDAQTANGTIVLPDVDDAARCSIADLLEDCMVDWVNDPGVGLYGPTREESMVATAVIRALRGA